MSRLFAVPVLAAVLALGVAGCGSSGSSSSTSTPTPSATGATVGTADAPDLGTILVDGQGNTLYLWEADTGSTSTCNDACATQWPPLLAKGAPKVSGAAQADKLGTSKRTDGTTQVTYGGHPLYTYAEDSAPGKTTGQGSDNFGAEWYVVAPSGDKVDSGGGGDSGGSASGGTSGGGGGGGY
jgi:predicted lipoprotein with Yx(FWY)xxD motif